MPQLTEWASSSPSHAVAPSPVRGGLDEARYLGYLVALVVFGLDQLVKWIVTGPLGVNQVGDQLYLLPFFQFTYTQNIGISLGLFNATTESGAGCWSR